MKIILAAFVLFNVLLEAKGQSEIEYQIVGEFQGVKPDEFRRFIRVDENQLMAIFDGGKDVELLKFSNDLKLLDEIKPDAKIEKSKVTTVGFYTIGDKVFRIAERKEWMDAVEANPSLFIQEINKSEFSFKEPFKLGYGVKAFNSKDLNVFNSENNEFVGITFNSEINGRPAVIFHVFDKNLNFLYRKFIYHPKVVLSGYYIEESTEVFSYANVPLNFSLTNSGKLYVFKERENFLYSYLYDNNSKIDSSSVHIGKRTINDIDVIETANGGIMIGYFSSMEPSEIGGMVTIPLEQFSKLVPTWRSFGVEYFYDSAHYGSGKIERVEKRAEEGMKSNPGGYMLTDIKVQNDFYYIIGERRMIDEVTTYAASQFGTISASRSYDYFYKDVVVSKLDLKGNLIWERVIYKSQSGSSFWQMISSDEIFILFNSNSVLALGLKKNSPKIVRIDLDGNLDEYILEGSGKERSKFFMTKSFPLKKDTVLLLGPKGFRCILGTFTLPD